MPIDGFTLPPPQYDVPPGVPVIEHVLSLDEVTAICTPFLPPLTGDRKWLGCALSRYESGKQVCIVYRIADERVRKHETAHCSGWPADHSNPEIKQATAPFLKSVQLAPWPAMPDGVSTEPQIRARERYEQMKR